MPVARSSQKEPPVNTVSINIRLSKDAREENLSVGGMEQDCRALAKQYGLTVREVHIDEQSGAIRNRQGFMAWLDDARSGRVDHLIAWHVDRMTREGVNVAAMILDVIEGKDPETGKLIRQPVRLLDTKGLDSFGDQTAFRFQFVIAAEVARAERERMRDRSRSSHRRLRAAGRWSGGTAPYGFQIVDNPDGPGKVLMIDEAEARPIREVVQMLLTGQSLLTATRYMNSSSGMKPRRASAWTQTILAQMLTGVTPGTRPEPGSTGHPIAGKLGPSGKCPAIITADEAAALRALLIRTGEKQVYRGRGPTRLLSGLLTCAYCGRKLVVSRRMGKGKGPAILYRCNTGRVSGTCDSPVVVSAEALDAYIERWFLDTWGDSPEYVRRTEVSGAAAVEDAQIAKAEALAALGRAPSAEAFAALQEAEATLQAALLVPQEAIVHVVPSGRTVREAWETNDVHLNRELLDHNLVAIYVKRGQRGFRGIDPNRLDIIEQPPHPLDESPEVFRIGAMAV